MNGLDKRNSPFRFSLDTLLKGFVMLAPPCGELWALHASVTSRLGPGNSAFGMYGRDVLVPLFFGVYLYLCSLQEEENLFRAPKVVTSLVNLFLLGGALMVSSLFLGRREGAIFITLIFFTLGLAALFSALFFFIDPKKLIYRLRAAGSRSFYAILGLLLLFCYPNVLKMAWTPIATATGHCVMSLLGLFGVGVRYSPQYYLTLAHSDLSARISAACSGLEGIFFFLFFYLLVRTFESKRSHWRFEALSLCVGTLYMFLLNTIRIALFFGVSLYLARSWAPEEGVRFFNSTFHSNIGWVLYFGGLILFFQVRSRTLARRTANH